MKCLFALKQVNEILYTDAAAESDWVHLDEAQGKPVTEREKALAEVITQIYHIVHPLFCKACKKI